MSTKPLNSQIFIGIVVGLNAFLLAIFIWSIVTFVSDFHQLRTPSKAATQKIPEIDKKAYDAIINPSSVPVVASPSPVATSPSPSPITTNLLNQ